MNLYIFFGLPGAGKTYVGKVAQKHFDYHLYDGDNDLPPEMQQAIHRQEVITDSMRDVFFKSLLKTAKRLTKQYSKLVIAQTFIKEKYRKQFLQAFPNARFVLIEALAPTREERLLKRKHYQLDLEYAKKMTTFFDMPFIQHEIIRNNTFGEEEIK